MKYLKCGCVEKHSIYCEKQDKLVYFPDGSGRFIGHTCDNQNCKPNKPVCVYMLKELVNLCMMGVIDLKNPKVIKFWENYDKKFREGFFGSLIWT
mgnify:CR=1 FL=1